MGLKTFKGGVHPYEGKELAKDAPIKEVLPKGELVFPLSQHIGAPATPIVGVHICPFFPDICSLHELNSVLACDLRIL